MFQVKEIKAVDTYPIRHKILRPHQKVEDCHYDGDNDVSTLHLGVFDGETLITIGSFFLESHPDLDERVQYRLRGMATLEEYRKKKAGSLLIDVAEKTLKEKDADLWWCNARLVATEYYIKLGLTQLGDIFEIIPIGLHKVMYKKL